MSFWSEKRLKREDLLDRLHLNLEKRGHRYAVDDGWRDWDVELRDSRFWKLQLTSVTEYHGDKERLVRLRFSSRATRMHIAGSALIGGFIGYIILTAASPFRMLWLVGLWIAWWFFLELHHRGQIEQFMTMARRVSYDLGFDRVKSESMKEPSD